VASQRCNKTPVRNPLCLGSQSDSVTSLRADSREIALLSLSFCISFDVLRISRERRMVSLARRIVCRVRPTINRECTRRFRIWSLFSAQETVVPFGGKVRRLIGYASGYAVVTNLATKGGFLSCHDSDGLERDFQPSFPTIFDTVYGRCSAGSVRDCPSGELTRPGAAL
jgi:hypothetical protein